MTSDDLWLAYTQTIVDIHLPREGVIRVAPASVGTTGNWPERLQSPIYIMTAWNPLSMAISGSANELREGKLEYELMADGLETYPAVGRDMNSDYEEKGVAVIGLSELAALSLGARYEQNAIFSWTPTLWEVLSCVDSHRHTSGWSCTSVSQPARY